jgi:hypothetical protein
MCATQTRIKEENEKVNTSSETRYLPFILVRQRFLSTNETPQKYSFMYKSRQNGPLNNSHFIEWSYSLAVIAFSFLPL